MRHPQPERYRIAESPKPDAWIVRRTADGAVVWASGPKADAMQVARALNAEVAIALRRAAGSVS